MNTFRMGVKGVRREGRSEGQTAVEFVRKQLRIESDEQQIVVLMSEAKRGDFELQPAVGEIDDSGREGGSQSVHAGTATGAGGESK